MRIVNGAWKKIKKREKRGMQKEKENVMVGREQAKRKRKKKRRWKPKGQEAKGRIKKKKWRWGGVGNWRRREKFFGDYKMKENKVGMKTCRRWVVKKK